MNTPNPKCPRCKCYWKPDETDIKTSGLVAKTCKKCRLSQKKEKSIIKADEPDMEYKKCSNCKCFKKYDEYEERRCGGHFKTCKKCRNKEVKEANEPDNKNIPDNTNTIIINDIIYEKLDYSRDDIINVNGDIYIKKIYHNSKR